MLLGFNEPDMAGQADMSVEDALAAWPALQATGMRLGSPAVAYGGDTKGGWLDRFMTGAKQKNLRVDFITLHWYGSDFSGARGRPVPRYVDAVHARYGLPIWVTEYGLMNFTGSPEIPDRRPGGRVHQGQHQGHGEPAVRRAVRLVRPARGRRQRRLRPVPRRLDADRGRARRTRPRVKVES